MAADMPDRARVECGEWNGDRRLNVGRAVWVEYLKVRVGSQVFVQSEQNVRLSPWVDVQQSITRSPQVVHVRSHGDGQICLYKFGSFGNGNSSKQGYMLLGKERER